MVLLFRGHPPMCIVTCNPTPHVGCAPPADMAVPAERKHAQAAHALVETNTAGAEEVLRAALEDVTDTQTSSQAVLLNGLGLCALHAGRAADATALLRKAVAALPAGTVGEPGTATSQARCQLLLNLCEAQSAAGQHADTLRVASAVVKQAQGALGLSATGKAADSGRRSVRAGTGTSASGKSRLSSGATSRLFLAKWLLPAAPRPGESIGVDGALPLTEALLLGWVWCALSQEGLGMFSESLKSYTLAMAVADVDRSAANALATALKKKVALTSVALSWEQDQKLLWDHRAAPPPYASSIGLAAITPDSSLPLDRSAPRSKFTCTAPGHCGASAAYAAVPSLTTHRPSTMAPEASAPAPLSSARYARRKSASATSQAYSDLGTSYMQSPRAVRTSLGSTPMGGATAGSTKSIGSRVSEKSGVANSVGTKSAFAVYALASAQRADSALHRDQRLREDQRRRSLLRAEAAASAEAEASRAIATHGPAKHSMEYAHDRAARLALPENALTKEQRAAFAASEAALHRRVQEGGRRAQVALAAAARRRISAMRQALGRIVWALTALLSEQSANTVLPFPRVLGEVEHLRSVELAGGSERRARSLSTALWLLRKCTPPTPPRRQADEGYAKAVAMLEWLLVNFDDDAEDQMEVDEEPEIGATHDNLGHAGSALHPESQLDLLEELVHPHTPNAAERRNGQGGSRLTMQAETSPPRRNSVSQPGIGELPLTPHRISPNRRGSQVWGSFPTGRRSTTSQKPVTNDAGSVVGNSEDMMNDPAGRLLSTLPTQQIGESFGEVVLSQPRGADQLSTQAPLVTSHHHTSQPHFRPTTEPIKIVGGKRLTNIEAESPMDSFMLEEEGRMAAREAEARSLAQLQQREQAQREQAECTLRETEERMLEYQEAKRYVSAYARSGADLEEQLAVDQRLWAHDEAEARRREVEKVLHRERELAAAQRERLGLSGEAVASTPSSRHTFEAPATLPSNPIAMHVTPEMVGLINDLHASFSLFSGAPVTSRDDPPIVVSGELIGGGEVPAADVELAIDSFGVHYLAPNAHQALVSSLHKMKGRNITFIEFVQTMLALMAEPNAQMQPQALASLYTAFVLFDDGGNGMVRMSEVELVLQALSYHMDTPELEELLAMVSSRLETCDQPGDRLLPFHSFIQLLVPGLGLGGARSQDAALGRTNAFAATAAAHPGEKAPLTALSEKIASFPQLDHKQTHLLHVHFASYAADEASGAASDHMPASQLPLLMRAMDVPIAISELAGVLRELGAHDAADQVEHGLSSSTRVSTQDGPQILVDYDTALVLYQAALDKLRQLTPAVAEAELPNAELRGGAGEVPALQFEHVFANYAQPDGGVYVYDIELLLNELGLHLTHTELGAVFECICPEEQPTDQLTVEQVRAIFKEARNLSYVDRRPP